MKLNKFLRILSVIFECSLIGSIVLYVYNYYVASRKYEVIPADLRKNLNLFVIVGIVSLIIFLIIKYVLYIRNKTINGEVSQLSFDLEEREKQYKNLEEPVTERVIIYKDSYDVPKDKRMNCPNCGSVIDKNAFVCVKCGYLLKSIKPQVMEKVIEKPVYRTVYKDRKEYFSNKVNLKNILINLGLVIAIVACLFVIINMAVERGIIK